ncbi:hypothetical protein A0H81_08245 [Grifola frondosa]|uniref:Uncharacterized protein n=1 Tax=Grifola frondosa TaxID=5627 RepID=A0A1C7M567_GRIFR|nr:hypothetical protein A0H81_08245 [Grifola frondosa]
MGKVLKLFAPRNMTLAEGAEASLWAATCPDINVSNWHEYQGNYYAHAYGKSGSESELAKDIEVARNYWNLCSTLRRKLLARSCLERRFSSNLPHRDL